MPKFYMILCPKNKNIFFLIFFLGGGGANATPVSYAYDSVGSADKICLVIQN